MTITSIPDFLYSFTPGPIFFPEVSIFIKAEKVKILYYPGLPLLMVALNMQAVEVEEFTAGNPRQSRTALSRTALPVAEVVTLEPPLATEVGRV